MQSFLQYRRFGRHVKTQYERDREKAVNLSQHGQETLPSPSTSSSTPPLSLLPCNPPQSDTRDVEKAEQSNGSGEGSIDQGPLASPPPPQPENPSLQRQQSETMSRATTVASRRSLGTNLGNAMTGIDVRHRTTREGGDHEKVFVVGYEGERDTMDPHNWSFATRIGAT